MGDLVIHEENPRKWSIAEEDSAVLNPDGFAVKRTIRDRGRKNRDKPLSIRPERWEPSWCGVLVKAYIPLSKNIPLKIVEVARWSGLWRSLDGQSGGGR